VLIVYLCSSHFLFHFIVNIWEAAEKAGRLLLSETRNVTVEIVNQKYGLEAAQATRDGLSIAGNVLETAYP
jgi:hypothetical protein